MRSRATAASAAVQVELGDPAAGLPVSFARPAVPARAGAGAAGRGRSTCSADRRRRAARRRFASPRLMPSVAPLRPGLPPPPAARRSTSWRSPPSRSRWPGPRPPWRCPRSAPRWCSPPTSPARCEARDVRPSRMAAVRRAALDFLDDAPSELRVGAVAFNHSVRSIEPPRADRADTREPLIERLQPSGGTATGEGLAAALGAARAATAQRDSRRPPAAVILLSDGASTHGRDPIAVAREAARAAHPGLHGGARHRRGHDRGASARDGSDRHARRCRPTATPCAGSRRSAARAPSTPTRATSSRRSTSGSAPRWPRATSEREVTAGVRRRRGRSAARGRRARRCAGSAGCREAAS